jgi:hypothetical protein
MDRALASVLLAVAVWGGASAQELPVLHLKVSVLDADLRAVPAARHALLISDNPSTAPPRRVVTSAEGIAQIRLRPGNYTVESDRPLVLNGRTYEWVITVDVTAGRDATIELTAANAVLGRATAELERDAVAAVSTPVTRAESILGAWQASAFELWTPHTHAAGFLADESGLVATSLRAIGDTRTVEVQVSQTVKVTGAVVVADPSTDVAVIRVHSSTIAGVRPVPLACDPVDRDTADEERYLIDVPFRGAKDVTPSLVASPGAAGGPVFAGDGRVIGLASPVGDTDLRGRVEVRLVVARDVCAALASARASLDAGASPDPTHLPLEPAWRPSAASVAAAAASRAFSLTSYRVSTSDFDVTFLTPIMLAVAEGKRGQTGGRADELNGLRVATDFENWAEYMAEAPAALFVRATPRLVEGFWMKVARGAASTQGAQIPPIKRLRPGFSKMRLVCGGKDVMPIHPFRIQVRVTETEAVEEGFYVFSPNAIGPDCGAVSIVLSSVKDPDKMEARTVDPAIVKQVWQDFSIARSGLDRN